MSSHRWQYLVVEVKARLFTRSRDLLQAELDKHGALGWELVSVAEGAAKVSILLFFKRQQ